jgi:hypothetical protein
MEIDVGSQLESNLIKIVDQQQQEPKFEPHVTDHTKNVLAAKIPEVVVVAPDVVI